MKNFGTLFGYEMKKIWMRPLTWVTVVVLSAAFVYVTAQPFFRSGGSTFTITDDDGNKLSRFVTAGEQYRIRVEGARALSGQSMDEAFFRTAQETVLLEEERFDKDCYFYLVDPSYCQFYTDYSEWLEGTAEYWYACRQNGLELGWQKLTGEETAYWQAMEAQVEKPFTYQPILGPRMLMNMLGSGGLVIYLPLLVGLCVCDLYAQERRWRACPLIFSSREGRLCLCLAKTLAGSASAVLAVLIVAGAGAAANLLFYGSWGFDGAIQLSPWLRGSSLPITMGQGILILLELLLAYALVCGAVTALVSVWSGSGLAAMAASVGVMLLSIAMDRTEPGWRAYMPMNLVDERGLVSVQLAKLFGVQLNVLQSGLLLYLGAAALLLALCWPFWRRWTQGNS